MTITVEDFGELNDHKIELFTLTNANNIEVKITNYGGIITSIKTPNKDGEFGNIVLGFDSFEEYISEQYLNSYPYFGAIIGRVGNRTAKGSFEIDGVKHQVSLNKGTFQLHGGHEGFDKKVWNTELIENKNEVGVRLSYLSVDGEEGYPGNLNVIVEYTLNDQNELKVQYFAETDKTTSVNLTQHTYFNLGDETTIENHYLQLNSSEVMEVDSDILPTGNLLPIENTLFDFRKGKRIGDDIHKLEHGYDHTYNLHNHKEELIKIAELSEKKQGRTMEVYSTEVSTQIYTGFWNPELQVNGTKKLGKFSGVAIETQHFPDAINQPNFKTTVLKPDEKYEQTTIFKFSSI
ncbi:aldose epimerase family protein [Urechidicola vernalis]|uniref:Aldose 1-epimerase n=1 Tax=Urechidicola vernalis TaxID=3075600 RepID=A0ABU2Y6T4_9FLAO|nr:aldose epimerase family protein [Urechidicola sp. P050]MDT0553485.1 aldose epimerase family protein [Urechidicola sp. P050]